MMNPTLSDLIGGIQTVTLGDDEARRRRTQKSVLERKAPPTFDVVVEDVRSQLAEVLQTLVSSYNEELTTDRYMLYEMMTVATTV